MSGPKCHILHLSGEPSPADMPAAVLALFTRGKQDMNGETARYWREQLAAAVGEGMLADTLRGPSAIRVTWEVWPPEAGDGGHYVIWPE